MKKSFLLPHYYMKVGLLMFVPFLIMCILELAELAPIIKVAMPYVYSDCFTSDTWFGIAESEDIYGEIWMIGLFLSLLFIALSKEKVEDEMLMQIRLQSLLFALWCTSALFIFETLFIYGLGYAFSLWAIIFVYLVIFILKFRYELYRLKMK